MADRALAATRQLRLEQLLRQQQEARVADLARAFGVSHATVRRDLAKLDHVGEIRRVRGGAIVALSARDEPLFDTKARMAVAEKRRIAQAALQLISKRETIFLDGGSTVLELARMLRDRLDLTVVTNSLRAALELASRGPRLILIGGDVRRISQTAVGPLSRPLLEEVHIDKAFIATNGMTVKDGFTTTDPDEAFTKRLAMQQAARVIVLADSSKAGVVSFIGFGNMADIHTLVTDRGADREFIQAVARMGVQVVEV
jgi:DeoR family fructose operon transcriptional repressor